jgi:hypothetical protein
VNVTAEKVRGTKKKCMSTTTVAHGIIERHAVAIAAADRQLLAADYTNDTKILMPDSRVQHGTTMMSSFEAAARFLTRPSLENDSHDLVGKTAAKGTTFEGANLPFRAT